ncbi:MAG TPA: anti-sigma factor antagonist [Ruminococcaceae bacterium]|nr:anti-sigma factor antagonist [Oscillospiraceae bacterium]
MEFKTTTVDNNVVLCPMGRLDSTTAGEFEANALPLITDAVASFTVDMNEVDFISSKGLRVLVSAHKKLNGKKLILVGVNNSVKEVLKLSGLLKIFDVRE